MKLKMLFYPLLAVIAGALLTLSASQSVWAKGHVPLGRVQICDPGKVDDNSSDSSDSADNGPEVKTVRVKGLGRRLNRGACRLPACDFANIFRNGDTCETTDANDDGFCDRPGSPPDIPADSAIGVTVACTNPY